MTEFFGFLFLLIIGGFLALLAICGLGIIVLGVYAIFVLVMRGLSGNLFQKTLDE